MTVTLDEQRLGALRWIVLSGPGPEAFRALGRHMRAEIRAVVDEWDVAGRLAPDWTTESAADWAWARIQPSACAHLVGIRGWDPAMFTERTVTTLLAELVPHDHGPPLPQPSSEAGS